MRFFPFVVSAAIFAAIAISQENLFQDSSPDTTDLSLDWFAWQDLGENSPRQSTDGDNGDEFLQFEHDSNAMEEFPMEISDRLIGSKPSCTNTNTNTNIEPSLNRLRLRDEKESTCSSNNPTIPPPPSKKGISNDEFELFNENMKKIFWPPDAPDISDDSRCLPTYPFHLCCLELSDPSRIVPGELVPGVNIPIYDEAYECVQALPSLRVPCFRPIDVCCQTTFPTPGSLDGSVDGYTCYKFAARR